jgi:hypothetical protein
VTITQIRSGLSTNLATISGLKTYAVIPENPMAPCAVVEFNGVTYDSAFARSGGDEYTFSVRILVHRVNATTGQDAVDEYCTPAGTRSIKAALEANKTLSGYAFDLRVTEVRNIGLTVVGETTFLTAEFPVTVYA